jgi:hypothetical protein
MITCEEAAIICNKAQYKEATFWEIVKLRFHLLICKVCALYARKNEKLTTLCQKANLKGFSEDEKIRMKQQLRHN